MAFLAHLTIAVCLYVLALLIVLTVAFFLHIVRSSMLGMCSEWHVCSYADKLAIMKLILLASQL